MPHELILSPTQDCPLPVEQARVRVASDGEARRRWMTATVDLLHALRNDPAEDRWGVLADCVQAAADATLTCVIVPRQRAPGRDPAAPAEAVVAAARGSLAPQVTGLLFRTGGSLSGHAFDSGESFLAEGAAAGTGGDVPPGIPDSRVVIGPTMVVPLAGSARPTAVVTASRPRGAPPFTDEDLEAAGEFGRQARAALELDAAHTERERLALHRDRDRIARDLHDRVIQRVFAAGMTVQTLAGMIADPLLRHRLGDEVRALDAVIAEIRTAVFGLSAPATAGGASVRRSILNLLDELGPLFPRPPLLAFSGAIDLLVPASMADDVLAVLREGLTNVIRHARAETTAVTVMVSADRLSVEISDDGVGLSGAGRGRGIASLRTRAERWQGMLSLTGCEPRGTVLRWSARLADVPDRVVR